MTPPGTPLVVGRGLCRASVEILGVGQSLEAMAVTGLLQTSRPEALKMSVIEQTLVPTGSVPLKFVPWPGSNLGMMMTGELLVGWLFTMTMLVIDTLPMLVIVPVKPSTPPGRPLVAGQVLVIANAGEVSTGQVAVAVVVTVLLQRSWPVAVTMSVIEQTLPGTGSV